MFPSIIRKYGKKFAILLLINNNGAEGFFPVFIEEMRELREFYLQNFMFIMFILYERGLLLFVEMF